MANREDGSYWNDLVAGATAGALVAPLVSAVDRALAENASGKMQLWPSFFKSLREMASRPIAFVKSPQFYWIWLVYGGTYVAVNSAETWSKQSKRDPALPKLMASFTVNTSTCIGKDRAFAKMFGTSAAKAVPIGSYGAWLTRDLVSMAVFFTLPPIVGKKIAEYTGNEKNAYYAAQIALPLALQTVTTPIHLLGYDIYNNPNNNSQQRIAFLKKDYWKNVSIRMLRCAPPWSFGTIGNREIRAYLNNL
jgi:hypothetical protein